MDKLAAMRTFVDIVDRGSLTAAAEARDRSLPTVVRTLAALERQLGARLLRRTTRRMSLTVEGRDYLERCRRILADVEEAELAVTQAQREPRGEIRMTAPAHFGQLHVTPAVTGFLARHPKVTVDLLLLDRVVNLVDEGFDLALRIGHLRDSSMVAVPVGHMRRVVCASPDLLRERGVPSRPEALAEHPCLQFRGTGASGQWRFHDPEREFGVAVSGSFRCSHALAVAEACADGLGFGLLLHYQVAPLVRDGRLAIVLDAFEPAPLPVSLVYPEARLVSSRLRALVVWLRDALRVRLDALELGPEA
jgi:DNA-binding transcriptional LysR family regulator